MGKSLVIKGADFSANAIGQNYYALYESSYRGVGTNGPGTIPIYPSLVVQQHLRGKTLYKVKLYLYSAGVLTLVKSNGNSPSKTAVTIESFTFTQDQVGQEVEMVLTTPHLVASNEWIGVRQTGNTGGIYYVPSSQNYGDGYWFLSGSSMASRTTGDLEMSFYSFG